EGQNDRALDILSKYVNVNPGDREIVGLAAQTAYDLKDYKQAASLYDKLTLTGGDAEDFQKLGTAYLQTGKTEEAAQAFGKALERNKNLKGVNAILAKIAYDQGQFNQALSRSEEELAIAPSGSAPD